MAPLAVLAIAVALLVALLRWNPQLPISATDDNSDALGAAGRPAAPQFTAPAPRKSAPAPAAAVCEPHANQACHEGDVWWFDSCGEPEEIAEPCDGRSCEGAQCVDHPSRDPRCVQVSAYGVCEGDRAVACVDDHVLTIDCAAKGLRCVTTREGARCMPRDPRRGCRDGDRPSCDGDELRECVDGFWVEIDCAARRTSCLANGDGARCGESTPPEVAAREPKLELCNGRDDDADGQIDEGDACHAVGLVAFVPQNARLTDLEQRMATELQHVNDAFAPLRFAWAKQVTVPAEMRVVDPERLDPIARLLAQQESSIVLQRARGGAATSDPAEQGLPFYIPVLFTERIRAEPPKAGVSTLPNAMCGGVRISDSPSPPYGVVVLADHRTPQTLSHELGHYLGLCHTHEELDRIAAATPDVPACKRSGDGICDTATDPGPDACDEVGPCSFYCRASAARPDGANLMSYYMHCRNAFTPEQTTETARILELRRGWFRCLDPRDCPCDPTSSTATTCPTEMSCHPRGASALPWICELDGPALPGANCQNSSQCSFGAICLSSNASAAGRCVRPCSESKDCACEDVGLPFQVCSQDFNK
jgi:hypothetical protein